VDGVGEVPAEGLVFGGDAVEAVTDAVGDGLADPLDRVGHCAGSAAEPVGAGELVGS
jgi:hypothetical protein